MCSKTEIIIHDSLYSILLEKGIINMIFQYYFNNDITDNAGIIKYEKNVRGEIKWITDEYFIAIDYGILYKHDIITHDIMQLAKITRKENVIYMDNDGYVFAKAVHYESNVYKYSLITKNSYDGNYIYDINDISRAQVIGIRDKLFVCDKQNILAYDVRTGIKLDLLEKCHVFWQQCNNDYIIYRYNDTLYKIDYKLNISILIKKIHEHIISSFEKKNTVLLWGQYIITHNHHQNTKLVNINNDNECAALATSAASATLAVIKSSFKPKYVDAKGYILTVGYLGKYTIYSKNGSIYVYDVTIKGKQDIYEIKGLKNLNVFPCNIAYSLSGRYMFCTINDRTCLIY